MKCDIIIPIWNELIYTKDCLDNILKNTDYPYTLILVDNASQPDTKSYLEKFAIEHNDKVKLIRNEENLGYIKAINQGMKISDAPYVVMMNNDTIPAPGWLNRMVDFAKAHPDVGLVNPQCGGHGDTPIDVYADMLKNNKGQYMEMNQAQGFAMLVKRELIDKIGLLDEDFGIGGYDDTDYSIRAHKAGYRSVAIRDSYVYHRIHASFDKAGNREEWVRRNQAIYYKKWGKHLRVGVIFSLDKFDKEAITNMAEFVYGLAREWSWVHVWINTKLAKDSVAKMIYDAMKAKELAPHQNIRFDYLSLPGIFLEITVAFKIIERLRKRMSAKRFDAILSFDKNSGFIVRQLADLLGIQIFKFQIDNKCSDWLKSGRDTALAIKARRDGK